MDLSALDLFIFSSFHGFSYNFMRLYTWSYFKYGIKMHHKNQLISSKVECRYFLPAQTNVSMWIHLCCSICFFLSLLYCLNSIVINQVYDQMNMIDILLCRTLITILSSCTFGKYGYYCRSRILINYHTYIHLKENKISCFPLENHLH